MSTKDVKFSADGRPLEAALAEGLEHPGIVRTVASAVTGAGAGDPAGETWLVMELCNGGDLQARRHALSSSSLHHARHVSAAVAVSMHRWALVVLADCASKPKDPHPMARRNTSVRCTIECSAPSCMAPSNHLDQIVSA